MELFDYTTTEVVTKEHWVLRYFQAVKKTLPNIGSTVKIHYTGWGDWFIKLEVEGKVVWEGKRKTANI